MIIGLYGNSRSGKDSIARIIQDNYGYEWRTFASTLRQILLDLNPYLPEMGQPLRSAVAEHGWDVVKALSYSSVEMMIALGQSVRDIDPNFLLRPVLDIDRPECLVISDVRQKNEYDAIRSLDGEVWHVIRPRSRRRGMDGLLTDYYFHTTIYNSGSLNDLEDVVKKEMDYAKDRWD